MGARPLPREEQIARDALSDEEREQLIERCERLVKDTNHSRELRSKAFALMAQLIMERSPAKVRQMEVAKFGRSFP